MSGRSALSMYKSALLEATFRSNGLSRIKRICVLVCSPDEDSLTRSLAKAYATGALSAGHSVDVIDVQELEFDPILRSTKHRQGIEPALLDVQSKITASQHVCLFFPTWWYGPPALLKGLLDRVLTPGWAYQQKAEDSIRWTGLLKGRSARVVYTSDTPPFVVRLFIGDPIRKAFKRGILGYSGMSPVRFSNVGSVRLSDQPKREKWVSQARAMGESGL